MGRHLLVTAVMIAVTSAAGCGKQLNRIYCDSHPDDVDCRNSGTVMIDAPMGECQSSAQCAGNPNGPVCDLGSQTCVQCIVGVDTSACSGATAHCGDDNACHGCVVDADCASSNVCLLNGQCADASSVLYARPTEEGQGSCTLQDPCSFRDAVNRVSAAQYIIKLTVTNGAVYNEQPITLSTTQPVQIFGQGATFTPTEDGAAITVTSGNVEIIGLTVTGAKGPNGSGVACTNTAIMSLRQMKMTDNTGFGVQSTGCTATVERSRMQRNPKGAMSLTAGKLEIRNNIIDHNGTTTLETGNVIISNATGRFVFNTVADNLSKGGGQRIGGINCTQAAAQTMLVTRNIVSSNGGGATFGGACTGADSSKNYTQAVTNIKFSNATDYKLTNQSPTTILRDDPDSEPECKPSGKYIDDYEGQSRPAGYCDRGADEYKP
jgi:hypothetical protein